MSNLQTMKKGFTRTAASLAIIASFAGITSTAIAGDDKYATAEDLQLMQGFPVPEDKRVDRSNALFTPPFNRWAYLNMRSVYPTAEIKNAEKSIPVQRAIDKKIDKLTVQNPDTKKQVSMDTYLKETYSDSLVVIKGDKIVYEKYLNSMNANQTHQMMSVTKSFAGLMGLMAVEDGKVKESDLVTKYIPELKVAGGFNGATFKQVLNMTNSIDYSEDYADPEADVNQYTVVLGLAEPKEGKTYAANIYEYLVGLQQDKKHPHGEVFHYQTPKTDVVNWVTNRTTGTSFQDDVSKKLWSKLGTDGDTYVLLDKNGNLFAGGGLNATPNDLSRFAMMMLNDGKNTQGEQLVSTDIIKKLSKGGNVAAFSNGPDAKGMMGNGEWSYRAQWWVRHTAGKEAFSAIGVNGQWIYIDAERDIAIIKQSSQPIASDNYSDQYNVNAYDTIIEQLSK